MNILIEREIMYIENASFLNSALLKEFDSKEQMYSWFRSLRSDVIKGSKWINGTNRSCTLFPLDLKVNGKEFWEYFEIKVPA